MQLEKSWWKRSGKVRKEGSEGRNDNMGERAKKGMTMPKKEGKGSEKEVKKGERV